MVSKYCKSYFVLNPPRLQNRVKLETRHISRILERMNYREGKYHIDTLGRIKKDDKKAQSINQEKLYSRIKLKR